MGTNNESYDKVKAAAGVGYVRVGVTKVTGQHQNYVNYTTGAVLFSIRIFFYSLDKMFVINKNLIEAHMKQAAALSSQLLLMM